MLAEPIDADAVTPEELLARYEAAVEDAVAAVGADRAADATGVAADRLAEVDGHDITVEEAAALLALDADRDGEALVAEVRDHVMLSMSTAVLDVDSVAADLDGDLSAREIQAKLEGRLPMSLAEYARIHHFVASRQ